MLVPINWLTKYIKLEHSLEEFGQVMTELEFMQDGPIKEIADQLVIDLEVRQNRPDVFSIIGIAREYAAYIDKPITEPETITKTSIADLWKTTEELVKVEDVDNVKRFCAVEINDITITDSPEWMQQDLAAYGIPTINNIVDITNYVMLEFGIPLHAFDYDKLEKKEGSPVLTIRKAKSGENFKTWQNTNLELTIKDVIISDDKKPVAIAGVIGGANSDIDKDTKHIILEAACYNQASIRRTANRHNIRTEASSRHEKFLNPDMIDFAIKRALYLIKELSQGKIVSIDDYYADKNQTVYIDFNIHEVSRLGGIELESEVIIDLLQRFGFEVISHNDAIGLDKHILNISVPPWRTDVTLQADLVEEVLRLYGYDNIKSQPMNVAAPDFATPVDIQLENILKQLLVELGLDEQILNPITKSDPENDKQIKIENPLSLEYEALRTSIRDTLKTAGANYVKNGREQFCLFEAGKVYFKEREADYKEQKRIETLYYGHSFLEKVKPDLVSIIHCIGLENDQLTWKRSNGHLEYMYETTHIADLYSNGFILFTENIAKVVDIINIPQTKVKTTIPQKIYEDISIIVSKNELLGKIADAVKGTSEFIKKVDIKDIFEGDKIGDEKRSVTLQVLFEDVENKLNREHIENFKKEIIKSIKKFDAILRDF